MLRRLLLVSAMIGTMAACSPAEPPLLIDGGQPPASQVVQEPPANTTDANTAISG